MYLDRTTVSAHPSPVEERETEFDCGGVQRVDGLVQLESEVLLRVQPPALGDHLLGEPGIDAPVPPLVRDRQGVAGHATWQSEVIKLLRHGSKTGLDVSEALPKRQLSEDHADELMPAREAPHSMVAAVALDQPVKGVPGQVVHELGEDELSLVHPRLPFEVAAACISRDTRSSR